MGHILFLILHFFAFMFGIVGLFFTIPMHLIYAATRSNNSSNSSNSNIIETGPTPDTHKVCPDCKEYIRHGAIKCRYFGCQLASD